MKKSGVIVLLVLSVLLVFTACSSESTSANVGNLEFVDNGDGTLTCLDLETSPFTGGGTFITVDNNEEFVNFQITNNQGDETVEYYKFVPSDKTVERLYYVSAMGTQFTYIMDYSSLSLTKVINADGEDSTESVKESGRFEKAETETKEIVESIMLYFEEGYGKTIDEAIE